MRRRAQRARSALLVILALTASLLSVGSASAPRAEAAVASTFNPGYIISDGVFYSPGTMTIGDIQAFLDSKVPTCSAGYTCLKSYRQSTWTRPADEKCARYEGVADQPAAAIIYRVARACRVNPRVLLVLLQKESGLVTSTSPSARSYEAATGYACPDTAPCDAQYEGFYNQVFKAAWQYRKYALNPTGYSYQAGRTQYVQWHPNSTCGGSDLYIRNQATAGLYIYTPYRPNAAAMANLYGTGDACSAYGNRNFWRLFTDWWGGTEYNVVGPLFTAWMASGGSAGPLGAPTSEHHDRGRSQNFRHGSLHWSPDTGARIVPYPLSWGYAAAGGPPGFLGYPTASDVATTTGGRAQSFQNGRVYYSAATGARSVGGPLFWAYQRSGEDSGPLGYPRGLPFALAGGGSGQTFQRGRVYHSPSTGARTVSLPLSWAYDLSGGPDGALGYPRTESFAAGNGGVAQSFQRGRAYYSSATGARAVPHPLLWAYDMVGSEVGDLGYPTGFAQSVAGGLSQTFRNGSVYYAGATGARAVIGVLDSAYRAQGGPDGPLGYPTGWRAVAADGGLSQTFQRGVLYHTPTTGTYAVVQPLSAVYDANGRAAGPLGYPVADGRTASGGGTVQDFQHGLIYHRAATGAHAVHGTVLWAYERVGHEGGELGYPSGPVTGTPGGGVAQAFHTGRISYSPATGARAVIGPMAAAYVAAGAESGALGYPSSWRFTATGGGFVQTFRGGRVSWTAGTGAHAVTGEIHRAYVARGAEAGALGYPIGGQRTGAGGALVQDFQHGTITWTAAGGATVSPR